MPPVDPDRDQQTIAAFELRTLDGLSIAAIAARLDLAPSTVLERLDRAEHLAGVATVRGAAAVRRRLQTDLGAWSVRLDREYAAGRVEITAAIRSAVALSGQLAALAGAHAPRRVDVGQAPPPAEPDPATTAAIRAALAQLAEIDGADDAENDQREATR